MTDASSDPASDSAPAVRYRARWVFPVVAAPISRGEVEIRNGTIVSVGPSRRGAGHARQAIDLGEVALVPGLVNAHTHLEFSDLEMPLAPPRPFVDWIRTIRARRAERDTDPAESITRGLTESAAAGVALVGEIATTGWEAVIDARDRRPAADEPASPRAVVFRELLAPSAKGVEAQLAVARSHVKRFDELARGGAPRVRAGLSPHAPYSVHPDLFEKAVALAAARRLPIAMHLAETEAELQLLDSGDGPLAEMLREFGFPPEALRPRRAKPLDYLRELARCERALVVHGNFLSREEIEFVARTPSLTVVYCPRTHDYFGHAEHPWREVLRRGGRVAVGTDSRASNPDLSLWNELLFLRERFPDFDPRELLAIGTIRGAEALGDASCGAIVPGEVGDLAVIALPTEAAASADPWEALFHPRTRVSATITAGRRRNSTTEFAEDE